MNDRKSLVTNAGVEIEIFTKNQEITTFKKARNFVIRESLNIESLLLRIERSQLRWFGYVSRMPHVRLLKQTLSAEVSGKKPVG